MMIYQIILITILGVLLAFYNAHIYAMANSRDMYYNKLVHIESGSLRFILVGMIITNGALFRQPWYDVFWLVLFAGICFWPVYNIVYNWVHGHSLFYLGSRKSNSSSIIDKTLHNLIHPAQALLILLTILWYPVKIYRWIEPLVFRVCDNICDWIIAMMFIIFFTVLAYKVYNKKL